MVDTSFVDEPGDLLGCDINVELLKRQRPETKVAVAVEVAVVVAVEVAVAVVVEVAVPVAVSVSVLVAVSVSVVVAVAVVSPFRTSTTAAGW
jgi:hypothetical protein